MNTSRIEVAAVVAGVLFMLIGAVLGLDAYLTWDIPATLVWPSLLVAGGIVMVIPRRGA
jgi:hypothetical protein